MSDTAGPARAERRARRSRAEQRTERSDALLAAAWEVFEEKGYDGTTLDEVAVRAGYSRMPIYTLFGDKQNLFFELWRQAVGQLSSALIGGIAPGVPLRKSLKLVAETIAAGAKSAPANPPGERLFFVVQTIALGRPDIAEKLEQLARGVVQHFAGAVRAATLAEGEALRSDAETVAAHLVAHINGLATVEFQTRKRYANARELTAIFTAIALR